MKLIHKSYKFRLYPNNEQSILLAKHFGSCRFVFNKYLNDRKETYNKDKTSLNYYDNAKSLTELKNIDDFSWLKEINSQSLQQSLKCLNVSYNNFFKNKTSFPKFKSKYDKQSFSIPQYITIEEDKLYIPKFKNGINIIVHRDIEGKICHATISKTPTNKYFVSLTCEIEYDPYVNT